jgi:nucleoid DNA-binding protein
MARILINELASVLSERKKLNKKEATNFVNELFNLIQEGLEQDRLVKVKGLGTFKIIEVDDRESVNVNTGERVLIEGHNKISFTPDALMKELVNKPFSQFETVVLNEGVDFADTLEDQEIPDEPETPEPQGAPETATKPEKQEKTDVPEETAVVEESVSLLVESDEADDDSSEAPLVDFVTETVPTPVNTALDSSENTSLSSDAESTIGKSEPETEDETDDTELLEEVQEQEESGFNWKKWLLPLVFCIVVFAGGYLIGKYAKGQKEVIPETVEQKAVADVDTTVADGKAVADEVVLAQQEDSLAQKSSASQVEQTAEPVKLDQYEKMDIRVQTGAYRIIGTDHLEKVKVNDNLTRICKRTIGPGMECYLEVYNNIKADSVLKPGTEIKIPKLELKKKRSQKQK